MVKISKRIVEAMEPGQIVSDAEIKGFVARRLDSGKVTFGYRYRDKTTNKQRWVGLGLHGAITPDEARGLAKKRAGEVANARDPSAERTTARAEALKASQADKYTVDGVLDAFIKRHVDKLKSGDQVVRALKVYVRPRIGPKSIYDLKRRDIVEMLDAIEDQNGPVMADRVLAHVRKAFNWQAARDDEFKTPIVKGMARTKPKERERDRVLDDGELRAVWAALDSDKVPEAFRLIVRTLLLTAQRRNEVGKMHAEEIDGDLWTIPKERYKTGQANHVYLTPEALRWIGNREGFIFSSNGGKKPFNGYSKAMAQLNAVINQQRKADGKPPLPRWTLHDLRRTGRSLMSRAGVPSEIAERVLGHVIGGVEGVYDRHSYAEEKKAALTKLAEIVESILAGGK